MPSITPRASPATALLATVTNGKVIISALSSCPPEASTPPFEHYILLADAFRESFYPHS